MRSLSSSPLTGSDAVSSRFAARYRRYAAASSSATVAMASLVMGSDSIIRSALRRACRLETNGCGCRDQRRGIPSWLPAEPTPTTVSALRPARCLVYWSISCSGNRYSARFENVQSWWPGNQTKSNRPLIWHGGGLDGERPGAAQVLRCGIELALTCPQSRTAERRRWLPIYRHA